MMSAVKSIKRVNEHSKVEGSIRDDRASLIGVVGEKGFRPAPAGPKGYDAVFKSPKKKKNDQDAPGINEEFLLRGVKMRYNEMNADEQIIRERIEIEQMGYTDLDYGDLIVFSIDQNSEYFKLLSKSSISN